ncbi:MAG: Hsp70 family protein [Deltaproteobacteria bacterium]|jgi:molecular chaperone DnaK|nr:Hsp70 family protein [Deltaproteobacteria bacterium]
MEKPIFGIDLGTTNSCISVLKNNRPRVIPIDGNGIVPSVVSAESNKLLVGRRALNRAIAYPEQSIRSIKRQMGTTRKFVLGEKARSPEEISSLILSYLRDEAQKLEGHNVERVVITVPAYFSDAQRRATIEAGELAGLTVERLINEPTAAAIFYDQIKVGGEQDVQNRSWSHALVYDLGGGTFDVSILRLSEIIEVISSTGDTHLGGDDFDDLIVGELVKEIETAEKVDISKYPPALARLKAAAEKAKIALSSQGSVMIEETTIPSPVRHKTLSISKELTRTELESMSESLINRTVDLVHQALSECSLKPGDIDRVLLVGGMTRMPVITQKMSAVFGSSQWPAVDPDLSVSNGAAVQGGIICGQVVDQILVDVISHTLSLLALSERMVQRCIPIIPRNSSIPAKCSRTFYTVVDYQDQVALRVFQGESYVPSENVLIGRKFLNLTPSEAHSPIAVEYSYDLNGIIHINAEQTGYGRKVELKIDSRNPEKFTNEDLANSFTGSFFQHDDDDDDDDDDDEPDFDDDSLEFPDHHSDVNTPSRPSGINIIVKRAQEVLNRAAPDLKEKIEHQLASYREALDDLSGDEATVNEREDALLELIEQATQSE